MNKYVRRKYRRKTGLYIEARRKNQHGAETKYVRRKTLPDGRIAMQPHCAASLIKDSIRYLLC
ncbi:MAG TPA: hypothetical protein DCY17_01325 [Clostridiales bacterium]|nr:hypothetical protein [Clostridiales bacterium]